MRFAFAMVCVFAAAAARADVGIGVSAKTDSATIYIPITVGRFMVEPFVRGADRDSESSSTSGSSFPTTSASASESQTKGLGVGIFRLVPFAERFTLYYGGRLARVEEDAKSSNASGFSSIPILLAPSQSSSDGDSVTPTLGFHYNIVERLSIGAEVGLEHTELDTSATSRSQSGAITQTFTGKTTTTETRADVILRFFF